MEEVKKFAEAVRPYWAVVEPVLTVRTEADYERAVARLRTAEINGRWSEP